MNMNTGLAIPLWVLLAFAGWTLLALLFSVGVYRWSRILTGRASLSDWRADRVQGPEFYQRAQRAHANSLENLPVYAAIVVVMFAAGASGPTFDILALTLLGARIGHTLVHVAFVQTNLVAGIRFAFYFVQLVCLFAMGGLLALHAAG